MLARRAPRRAEARSGAASPAVPWGQRCCVAGSFFAAFDASFDPLGVTALARPGRTAAPPMPLPARRHAPPLDPTAHLRPRGYQPRPRACFARAAPRSARQGRSGPAPRSSPACWRRPCPRVRGHGGLRASVPARAQGRSARHPALPFARRLRRRGSSLWTVRRGSRPQSKGPTARAPAAFHARRHAPEPPFCHCKRKPMGSAPPLALRGPPYYLPPPPLWAPGAAWPRVFADGRLFRNGP